MKNAVPPTTASAMTQTRMTAAMRIEIQVFRLLAISRLTYPFDEAPRSAVRRASRLLQKPPRLFGVRRVIIALAELRGRLKFLFGRRLVAGGQRQLSELEVRPAVDPRPPVEADRMLQIGL